MREIAFLHYSPGNSIWHRHDPRLKLFELTFWTVSALAGPPLILGVTGLLLILFHRLAGSRIRRFRRPLLFWLVMALSILIAGGLAESEPPLVLFGWSSPVGSRGLLTGALRALRLLVVLLAGQLLAATTDPADLADAVRRITFFLPKSWSGTLAMAISLTITCIPRLLDEAATVSDAALSRGLGERRSIFRWAFFFALPLAEGTLHRADLITEALLSRCFIHNPTPPALRVRGRDWLLSGLSVLPVLMVLWASLSMS